MADMQVPAADLAKRKRELRRILRDRRARFVSALPASTRAIAFRVLPRALLARIADGATVALYHAIGDEAPTAGIGTQLVERGHPIALPRTCAAGHMTFVSWTRGDDLFPSRFGTLEPGPDAPAVAPDVFIAPLVGFDPALNRLGQGGGHYDRTFADHPDALRIGLAWSAQRWDDRLPVEATDRPLDIVVTEAAMFEREGDER